MYHLIQDRFNFVELILHHYLHNFLIIHYKTNCMQTRIYNINALCFLRVSESFQFANMSPPSMFLTLKVWSNKVVDIYNKFKNMKIVIKMA